ncbi:MAG TPA: hypothetical protein VNT25_02815 [Allosphingosinicella sp.]|nr:hypothetical protein [Allosphingosinicella sp.]
MSLFEYVMLLVSVVLSLGIARLLESHAHLLKLGKSVRWSWTYLLWLVLIFVCHIDLWGSLWVLRSEPVWTLPALLATILAAMALFYAAVLSIPEHVKGEPLDLWEFHMANRHRYVGALAAYLVLGIILNAFVLGGDFAAANVTTALPGMALLAVAIFVRNRWVQVVVPLLLAGLLAVYFAQYLPAFKA